MKTFKCVCGRVFENPQSFNGHKSHCAQHLESTGRLHVRQQVDQANKNKISKTLRDKALAKNKECQTIWENEKHVCERCGKIMKVKYGSGRFCSKKCANSKKHTEITKQKMRAATLEIVNQGLHRGKIMHDEAVNKYNNSPKLCEVCGKELPYNKRENQTCSQQCYLRLLKAKSTDAAKRSGGNLNPCGVRGTAKYGTYKGIHCDSSWELAYVIYCLDNGVDIVRNLDGFQYTYHGDSHMYYPDFIVNGVYIEVKNFNSEQVQCKIQQFPEDKKLTVLFKQDMKKYINYCTKKYGKDYPTMYDGDKPSWMDKIENK